ncbi:MAG: sigma-70 family RNA polymerase sigma factor [Actinobacteria bacterium]|nr:sigma-70 family RNA polymerase sigma factor [Actinomycetota bacterium]
MAERLAARDHGALAELYDRFAPFVYALAQRVSRDRHGAEDVTQEVFLGLWQKPGRFDPDLGSLRAWLGTLTHRTAVTWVRRQVAAHRRENGASSVSTADDVADIALSNVTADQTREVVAGLPESQREVVELAYFDHMTYRQVAKQIGVPEGTAKSRLRRALQSLSGVPGLS